MICLIRLLYYESAKEHLPCKKCPFYAECDDPTKDKQEGDNKA